jgi:transposase-like protein
MWPHLEVEVMKPKLPARCPDCGAGNGLTMTRLYSRIFAEWNCTRCGSNWRADASTGKLITHLNTAAHIEGEVTL